MEVEKAPGAEVVEIPPPDPNWLPVAAEFYHSLALSGQSRFYEPSDWRVAHYIASLMTMSLQSANPAIMARVQAGFAALLATEGDRRRARIELERAKAEVAAKAEGVPNLDDYRDRLAR